jgi:putative ABC transport system permease protein
MKRILAIFKIALRALLRNKMRAFLTMLGIICGVAAVITTVSLGRGAKAQIEQQIASLGQNVIQIWSGSTTRGGIHTGWGSAGTLTIEDTEAIQREIAGVITVSPEVRSSAQIASGNENWLTQILGESADYFAMRSWPMIQGTSFTEQDVRTAGKSAVIGRTVADQLFPGEDPLGQVIRIKNSPFIVVGVLSPKGFNMFGQDQDDVVIIPYTSAMKRLLGVTTLRSINVQASSPDILASAQQQITLLLRQRHRITNDRDDDFTVRTQEEIAQRFNEASETMRNLLAGVAAVSLIVGGIGIMNIMLVSVTERTREIGIRMSVGARSRDVMLQFLIEAVTLSAIGGIIGILAGVGASKGLTYWKNWPTLTPLSWVAVSVCCSAIVGIVFGFYPARKASQLDPIDALRYE